METSKYLIVGGGMVAGYAAKELVERGLKSGELTIVSADSAVPYERPPLSKGFLAGRDAEANILINTPEWYRDRGINMSLNTIVATIDVKSRQVRTASGDNFGFQNLLLATGCQPRKLAIPGNTLPGVLYLRSMCDAQNIRSRIAGARSAVVIGGGFIGMEVASVVAQKNIETTLIIREDRVCSRVFTPEVSSFFERYYSNRGVDLVKEVSITALQGKDTVQSVLLSNGQTLACDLVVVGIGATPVTSPFENAGIDIENGVVVNEFLETSQPGVSAAGDIANYPDSLFEKRRRVEHWDSAVSQAQHWARSMTGGRQPFVHIPYFFSDVFDLSYELWGDPVGGSQVVIRGDTDESSFSAWWVQESRLMAAFVMNRPDEERQLAPEWIQSRKTVSAAMLADNSKPLQAAA
ncbi:MAG TPA: FAD-dependent oxidoreductase [Terriglobales bacterium]|nr:FAD-dependent oxidoreductase [Terriglobales bacterium]